LKQLLYVFCFLLLISPVFAQEADEELTELLEEYLYDDEPGVVIYAAYDGEAWVARYGLANLDTGEEIAIDDLFRIASVTKPLVATVVLQLVDEGEIGLDDPIADYLPANIVDEIENANEATVRQMLQMTSGIFDYTESDDFFDAVEDDPNYMWTAEEVLEFAYGEEPYSGAGDDYYYSNTNYILAQLIIESVTGNSLADELDSRIFETAGMDSCYLETAERFAEGIVRGYQWGDDDDYEDITEISDGTGLGDGGVICSAEDLAKFLPALMDGEYLEDDTLEEMLDTVSDGEGGEYGLGIGYDDTEYGMMLSHDGASSGFQSVMAYIPDEDIVVVILTNDFDSEIMEDLTYDVLDFMWED